MCDDARVRTSDQLLQRRGAVMSYKVFLVEDEVVTREGMRDSVGWQAHGFEFCGEAPDGEMALPLLQAVKPDLLITDIRMPFMDGLELSRIVRDRMPGVKIIILSGHDEFEYAQKAISLGVSEYLLKPISVQDLHAVLRKVAAELDRESGERLALHVLCEQIEESRSALRERFLLKLVTGAASPADAIEKGASLGIDLVARCYQVIVARVDPLGAAQPFDYGAFQRAQQIMAGVVGNDPDVFLLRQDAQELVLLLKGSSPEHLQEARDLLLERARQELGPAGCRLTVGSGAPQMRIGDICASFVGAMDEVRAATQGRPAERAGDGFDKAELLKVDRSAVEDYLRTGTVEGFDPFFEAFVRPLGEGALRSPVVDGYIFMDIVLAAARFVDEMGGDVDRVVPELDGLDAAPAGIETLEQLRARARAVLLGALVFRDGRAGRHYVGVIKQAEEAMERRYMEPELSLNDIAAQVNLSPCHFSAVFSQETGRTFKECLTEIRIKKAKELLRTTALKTFEICYQVGYNDPHYFSHVFKKQTGVTPGEFRAQVGAAS
jgi:two-component system, response regulator YesN